MKQFTFVEFVFILVFIVAIGALLVPSWHSSRRMARVTQCLSDMRRCYTLLYNYDDIHEHLPRNIQEAKTSGDSPSGLLQGARVGSPNGPRGLGLLIDEPFTETRLQHMFCDDSFYAYDGPFGASNWGKPGEEVISWAYRGAGHAEEAKPRLRDWPDLAIIMDHNVVITGRTRRVLGSHDQKFVNFVRGDGRLVTVSGRDLPLESMQDAFTWADAKKTGSPVYLGAVVGPLPSDSK